ncbi:MAG: hypothetical protein COS76_00375 [Candidatus Portnoybacteria bacterium CG06_land_8_20_14_3_00_39_12]|uniref:Uncharacterized protein n=1 Tax=Candidatus Portnoybacteria bacterium CG06_land_8_20_14_3_00_39_12 TaxID=1974809 RepID=A0A2M7AY78_9BACT|nr:MAG: hypothetical protein AUJ33_01895 [Parcubacteria group bacterium CG1_02_40_25]PIU75509.1 MAG: hypothetical protein COS76_00375 [Candidatus Portnoybacteria bacterium CG06_land_8_20_14_3_00_39_12]
MSVDINNQQPSPELEKAQRIENEAKKARIKQEIIDIDKQIQHLQQHKKDLENELSVLPR